MPAIANHDMEPFRFAVEVRLRDGHDRRVDFHDLHLDSFAGQLGRHHTHAQPDAEGIVHPARVGAGQVMQHVGEQGHALFFTRVIDILRQKIVQVRPASAALVIDDLQQAEVRVAAKAFHKPGGRAGAVAADAGEAEQQAGARADHDEGLVARSPFPGKKRAARHEHQRNCGEIHRPRIREKRDQQIADEHRARETSQRADGGEAPDVSTDAADGAGEQANEKRPNHRQQRERNKEQECRREERAEGQFEIQTPVRHRLDDQHRQTKVNRGQHNAAVSPAQFRRAVHHPAAGIVTGGQGHERHRDLRRPHKMRGADVRREHFGAENLDDHDGRAGDGGGEIEITAQADRHRRRLGSDRLLFHAHLLLSPEAIGNRRCANTGTSSTLEFRTRWFTG